MISEYNVSYQSHNVILDELSVAHRTLSIQIYVLAEGTSEAGLTARDTPLHGLWRASAGIMG